MQTAMHCKPGVQTRGGVANLNGVRARSGAPLFSQGVQLRVRSHTGRHAVSVRAEKVRQHIDTSIGCNELHLMLACMWCLPTTKSESCGCFVAMVH